MPTIKGQSDIGPLESGDKSQAPAPSREKVGKLGEGRKVEHKKGFKEKTTDFIKGIFQRKSQPKRGEVELAPLQEKKVNKENIEQGAPKPKVPEEPSKSVPQEAVAPEKAAEPKAAPVVKQPDSPEFAAQKKQYAETMKTASKSFKSVLVGPPAGQAKTMDEPTKTHKKVAAASEFQEAPAVMGNKLVLPGQADFKTAQGPEADARGARVALLLISGAKDSGSVMESVTPAGNTPTDQFGKMTATYEGILDEANLSNPEDCQLLNFLAGLVNKGSGSGIGQFLGGWQNDWADLGGKNKFRWTEATDLTWEQAGLTADDMRRVLGRDDLDFKKQKLEPKDLKEINAKPEFSNMKNQLDSALNRLHQADLANNEKLKTTFNQMLNFLNQNYKDHFDSSKRNPTGVDLAAIQLMATFGQLVHDGILDRSMRAGERLLKKHMIANGLIDPTNFEEITRLEKAMRNNPLLAEVPNQMLKTDIVNGLSSGIVQAELTQYIRGKLEDYAAKNNIGQEKLDDLTQKIVEAYKNEIRNLRTNSVVTGDRGRVALAPSFNAPAGQTLAGAKGTANSISIMPNRSDDAFVAEKTREVLDDPQTTALMDAMSGSENQMSILSHGGSPTNVLRLGKGLDSALVEFADHPEKLFQNALESLSLKAEIEEQTLLTSFIDDIGKDNNALKDIVGSVPVTFNKATNQKISLSDMASHESVASIMYKNNLRTICSISGTTVDAGIGLMLSIGPDGMRNLLRPFYNHTQSYRVPPPDPLPTPGLDSDEGRLFKEFFCKFVIFMDGGQYHTDPEVLGGKFIQVMALYLPENENIDRDSTFKLFNELMKEFAAEPEKFLPASPEDVAKINSAMPGIRKELRDRDLARIEERRNYTNELNSQGVRFKA